MLPGQALACIIDSEKEHREGERDYTFPERQSTTVLRRNQQSLTPGLLPQVYSG